jgi:uncharacterized protein
MNKLQTYTNILSKHKKLLFVLLFIGFILYVFSLNIEVTKYKVSIPFLPKEAQNLKIVQLSDLHRRKVVPDLLIESAVSKVNNLRPDVVVLTGDFVSKGLSNSEVCAKLLSRIKARFGVYAVLGNHDHWENAIEVKNDLEANGIKVLVNDNIEILPNLYLIGLDDYWVGNPDFEKAWRGVPDKSAQIFLSHNPLAIKEMNNKTCFMISGHTHGGQINIPGIKRNKLPGLLGWKYIKGWYRVSNTLMYVNRGIGMINPPVRIFCRPEVTEYVLKRDPSPSPKLLPSHP